MLKIFSKASKPLQVNEISKSIGIKSESKEYPNLKKALNELVQQNIVAKSSRRRYSLIDFDQSSAIKGILRIKDDSGVVATNNPEFPKVSIKRRHLLTAFDGDLVIVKPLASKKDKKLRGEIIKVVQRQDREIIGTVDYDGNFYFLIPDDPLYYIDFLLPSKYLNGAGKGDKVQCRFLQWDDPLKSPSAEVVELLGKAGDPKVQFQSVAREFNLVRDFSPKVLEEVKEVAKIVNIKNHKDRLDLRDTKIVTIDPVDAKDFDDALSLEILENGNFWLGVHIADVSYYVRENSELDKEALKRGTSVYLVDQVINMLPEELSTDMCSLRPNRVRLAYSVFMEYTYDGELVNYQIGKSVIKSSKRYNYDEVHEILAKDKDPEFLGQLNNLAKILRKKRFELGGINFETMEVKFLLDENLQPVQPILRVSNDATQLVEECMLAANKTVAEHIEKLSKEYKFKSNLPFLYRIHDEPNPDKINSVLDFIKSLGVHHNFVFKGSKDINTLLDEFEGRPEKPIVNQLLVRSMPKAEYSVDNIGHYGLGFDFYTHFTSPIRRYPDLIVHRTLEEYTKERPEKQRLIALNEKLEDAAEISTVRERASMEAERESIKLTQCILAKKYLMKEFNGTISGVTNFGIFVLLDDLYAEGLLHIKDLHDDYYIFDEAKFRLVGRSTKKIYHFGKRLRVRIIDVNTDKKRIELDLVSDSPKEESKDGKLSRFN